MAIREPIIGELYYYVRFEGLIDLHNPFEEEYKCIYFDDYGRPIFARTTSGAGHALAEGYGYFKNLKTKDEILAILDKKKKIFEEQMHSKEQLVQYMIRKLERFEDKIFEKSLNIDGAIGAFTNSELEVLKEKTKEYFDIDINIPNRSNFKR